MTVLLIVHYSWRGTNHLKLSAHFLDLLSLLLERRGQGLNLPFLQSNLRRLLLGRGLQFLHSLTLFEPLFRRARRFHRARQACTTTFAKLTVCTYADRVAADWYTRDAGDKGGTDEIGIADPDCAAFTTATQGAGGRADVDVIAAFNESSCVPADDGVKGTAHVIKKRRVADGCVCRAVGVATQCVNTHGVVLTAANIATERTGQESRANRVV